MPYLSQVQWDHLPDFIKKAYQEIEGKAQQIYRNPYVPYRKPRLGDNGEQLRGPARPAPQEYIDIPAVAGRAAQGPAMFRGVAGIPAIAAQPAQRLPVQGPQAMPGELLWEPLNRQAPIPLDLETAHNLGRNINGHIPFLNAAQRNVNGASGEFNAAAANRYMDPYSREVADKLSQMAHEGFAERTLPQLEAQFVRLGQHGSRRHQELALRAARDLNREIQDKQKQIMLHGYEKAQHQFNTDQARKLLAAEQYLNSGKLNQAGSIADIAKLENQGKYQQMQAQAKNDLDFSEFLRREGHDEQKLAAYVAQMQGIPYEKREQQVQHFNAPHVPQQSMSHNLGQLAGQMLGASMAGGFARGGYVPHRRW